MNKIIKTFSLAFSVLFLAGIEFSLKNVFHNDYLSQRMYNLALLEITRTSNKIVLFGLGIILAGFVLLLSFRLIWLKIFSGLIRFSFRVTDKKLFFKSTRLIILVLLSVWALAKFIVVISRDSFSLKSLLIYLLVYLAMCLVALQIGKGVSGFIAKLGREIWSSLVFNCVLCIGIIAFVGLNLFCFYSKHLKSPKGPNVVLIVADALRADHLGCYGYDKSTSPNIDKFASESLLFEKAFTNASWTKPAIASLFTSLLPHEHGAYLWPDKLSTEKLTIAEIFKNTGSLTYAFQTNSVLAGSFGYTQGFEIYQQVNFARAEEVVAQFLSWLDKNNNKRFFAYLHFFDTHAPYNVPAEFGYKFGARPDQPFKAGKFKTVDVRLLNLIGISEKDKAGLIGLYDGAINYLDDNLAKIIAKLKEFKLWENSIIIFTSDHGEELFDHDNYDHGHSQYEEILRIPLIISFPGKVKPERIKSYVQLSDLPLMLVQLAGIKSGGRYLKGFNLESIIKGEKKEVFSEAILLGDEKKALLQDNWKLIENTGRVYSDTLEIYGDITRYIIPEYKSGYELYNLLNDPKEKINLNAIEREKLKKMKARLKKYSASNELADKENRKDSERTIEIMKSLGYVH